MALIGFSGDAQDPLAPATEVRLVEIRVVVEDGRNQPVDRPLSRQDFELSVDGLPRPIAAFEGPSSSGASNANPTHKPQSWIFYIDPTFLEPGDLDQVARDLQEVVLQDLPVGTLGGLVVAHPGLEFWQRPTADRTVLAGSLEGVRNLAAGSSTVAESRTLLTEMSRLAGEVTDTEARNRDQAARALLSRIQAHSARLQTEMTAAAERLQRLVGVVAGSPKPAVLVVVLGRLPTRAESALAEAWRNAFGHTSGWDGQAEGSAGALGFGVTPTLEGGEALRAFRTVARAAQARGVTVHTVDAGALREGGYRLGGSRGFGAVAGSGNGLSMTDDSVLRHLAEESGGRAVLGGRGFREGLQAAILEDLQAYRLSFALDEEEEGEHDLTLRLPGVSDLSLRYRNRIHLRGPDEGERDATLAALVLGSGTNPLALEVAPGTPRRGPRGALTLPLTLRLPLANLALVAQGREHVGRLSVFSASGTLAGGATPVTKASLPVRIANEDLLTALGRPVEYRFEIPWREGADVAVILRDDLAPLSSVLHLPLAKGQGAAFEEP